MMWNTRMQRSMWLKWLVSSSLATRIRLRSCHGRQRLPELFQRLPYAAHRANWQTAAERVWQWCLELLTAVARYAELLLSKAHVRRDTSCARFAAQLVAQAQRNFTKLDKMSTAHYLEEIPTFQNISIWSLHYQRRIHFCSFVCFFLC